MPSATAPKRDMPRALPRAVALALGVALTIATLSGLVPGLTDASGRTFGLFKLNAYQNLLHTVSALWAFSAAYLSRSAAITFLRLFGTLYFLDGVMGTITGSGFLDLSIITQGVLHNPPMIKFLSSVPHLGLGAFGILVGFFAGSLATAAPAPREARS